jgi:hypothetical protein
VVGSPVENLAQTVGELEIQLQEVGLRRFEHIGRAVLEHCRFHAHCLQVGCMLELVSLEDTVIPRSR